MSQDMYDMNIPNITIPHIDRLEETLAVSNRISQSVNVAGMSAALATVSSVAASIPTGALEGAMTACNMASSMLDNSIVESTTSAIEACATIYDSPALQAVSEATEIVSDSLPSKFLEESLEVSNAVIESSVSPITHAATSVLSVLYLTKLVFLYGTKFRIERHQLSSGIVSSELPLDTSCMFIALPLPCRQFLAEQIHVLNPAGQTLPCHYI